MNLIFDTLFLNLCLIPALFIVILLIQYYMSHSYWKSKNIPFISPKFPFGNVALLPTKKLNSPEWFAEVYKAARIMKVKYIGILIFTKPILVVVDPDIIESILTKEEDYFCDSAPYLHKKIFGRGISIKEEYKRNHLEMKTIFNVLLKYYEDLQCLINCYIVKDQPIDIADIFQKLQDINTDSQFRNYCCSVVSTTINYCLFELSKNENIQNKLLDEIVKILSQHDNVITYDALLDMTCLDQTIYETLRKYPPVPLLKKELKKCYTFSGNTHPIQKGIELWIPIIGLHNDIWHYKQPELFNPDRFSKEEKLKRHSFTYLPFGSETEKFSDFELILLQIKIPLIILLRIFTYAVDPVMTIQTKCLNGQRVIYRKRT